MSAAVVAAGARDAGRGVTAPRLLSVERDRDNVVFVDDERLVTPLLADALGVDEREAARAFRRLCELYPAAKERAAAMGVPALARLCSDLPGLSRRLVALEALFPECDCAAMAASSPWLLELSADEVIRPSLEALQSLFPEAGKRGKPGVHRMVQAVPQLLDASFAARATEALAASLGVSRGAPRPASTKTRGWRWRWSPRPCGAGTASRSTKRTSRRIRWSSGGRARNGRSTARPRAARQKSSS